MADLIPVGTECQDAKHGARCRVRGYRLAQAQMNATNSPGATIAEVELLEDATIAINSQGGPVLFEKGHVVQTGLGNLAPVKP